MINLDEEYDALMKESWVKYGTKLKIKEIVSVEIEIKNSISATEKIIDELKDKELENKIVIEISMIPYNQRSKQIRKIILNAHSPKTLVLPNVAQKDSPSLKESWAKLFMGTMKLDTGKYDIVLQAVRIPGNAAGEFRALEIIKNTH